MPDKLGRGGWSKIGMPANGTEYYQLLEPVHVGTQAELGLDFLAVNYAVRAIQKRINGLGFRPRVIADGNFGTKTHTGLIWAQHMLGVVADGQFGPKTSQGFFWPVIQDIAGELAHTVGGICAHESSFDPGAVGRSTPDDHGLVQINAPANRNISIAQAFDHRFAFTYCTNRIANAMNTFHNLDIAICSYASPQWAEEWARDGHAPNPSMQAFVDWVKAWVSLA